MANPSISCLCLLISFALGSACAHLFPMFVFGDSILDTGNNNYIHTIPTAQANYWPYGQNFFKYPTGRWSDARIVPDFFAEYANSRLLLPYLHPWNKHYMDGANFASGGAGALDEINRGLVISLNTQLRNFNKVERILREQLRGYSQAKALLSEGVYLFSIGTNDYRPFPRDSNLSNSYSLQQYVDLVIGNLTTVIQEIHKKGGRKFVVLNIWSPNHVPAVQEAASRGEVTQLEVLNHLIELHNGQLYRALQKLTTKLKGFRYSYADSYKVFNEMASNPAKYGLKEVNVACCGSGKLRGIQSCGGKGDIKEYELCGNPREHLFYDANHASDRAYQILAQMIWNGDSNSSRPVNVKSLFQS